DRARGARQDALGSGDHPAAGPHLLGDQRGGDVAVGPEVLGEGALDRVADRRPLAGPHWARAAAGSGANPGSSPALNTKRPSRRSSGARKSRRVWVPRDSRRTAAAETRERATQSRLRTSASSDDSPRSSRSARSRELASRSTPASRV